MHKEMLLLISCSLSNYSNSILQINFQLHQNLTMTTTTSHSPILTMNHQIPFRQPTVTTSLNWAFASPPASSLLNLKSNPSSSPLKSRKRLASDESSHLDHLNDKILSSSAIINSIKRPKKTTTSTNSSLEINQSNLNHHSNHEFHDNQMDLGKQFASLTKPELIKLLEDLLKQKPDLKSTVQSLVPTPTLDSVSLRLEQVEQDLVQVIPNKRMNRHEYIWNRVRVPLNHYVNECLNWLRLSNQTLTNRGRESSSLDRNQIYWIVSDQFILLSRISQSIKKVENLLPDSTQSDFNLTPSSTTNLNFLNQNSSQHSLQAVLIPTLFENWKRFLEIIYQAVFIEGIILSESLILKWFNALDELASQSTFDWKEISNRPNESQNVQTSGNIQKMMSLIRDETRIKFGELVGLKSYQSATSSLSNRFNRLENQF
ncbi:hypothetical protein O181_088811 [Austropuccinia psidii MF-1]|uniref:Tethering factor for nuclear proteasome STS1 n=1 Tax=Austropuccinia psidii MF-1 TaxID=1389203 RepID=A0A9Q3P797_9BASI|nr:hypothetical protein [Austropuccinia psidii MF-1]